MTKLTRRGLLGAGAAAGVLPGAAAADTRWPALRWNRGERAAKEVLDEL